MWSPIPGWVLLGGISYGFYRLFRNIKRAQDAVLGNIAQNEAVLDSLFTQDPHTREMADWIQKETMSRINEALLDNEGNIQTLLPLGVEMHYGVPTKVAMVNSQELFRKEMVEVLFEIDVTFRLYSDDTEELEVTARANVIDENFELITVDIREVDGRRRVQLKGCGKGSGGSDQSGVGKGEGEGKTIDATKWTSK
jgi:hypothetical protein